MTLRSALCAMCLVGLVDSGLAHAGTNDILIGLDNKITYSPEGPRQPPAGQFAVGPANQPTDHTRRQARLGRQFRGSRPGGQLLEIGPG